MVDVRDRLLWRRLILVSLTALGLLVMAMLAANVWVVGASSAYVYADLKQLPHNAVGLVLGTSPYTHTGNKNILFVDRIKAAAELYQAGKIEHILVSGSNPSKHYNEPREMYQALREAGVPDAAITLDFAGFRTFDSVVRAGKVFGLQQFTIVSQCYHDYRAVFIARHKGLDVVAYCPPWEDARQSLRTEAREFFARIKAVLDLYLLGTTPEVLGDPIHIQIKPPTADGEPATTATEAPAGD